jgi:pilus assembly protein Flp/PilA
MVTSFFTNYMDTAKSLQLKAICNQPAVSIPLRHRARPETSPKRDAMEANTGKETHDMDYFRSKLLGLIGDKRAVTALEYAMIASLIAVAAVTVITGVGTRLSGVFSAVSSAL